MSGGSSTQLEATLRVALARGLGPRLVSRLRRALGDDAAICAAGPQTLAGVPGIGRVRASALHRALREAPVDAERSAADRAGVRLVADAHRAFPPLLKTIPDPPPLLWVRGRLPSPTTPGIAIVGSRRCTMYGREQATRLAGQLASSGLVVTSGGARGIDAAAHTGALRAGGATVAVVGCGHQHCYPAEHAPLFDRIVDGGGAVVSEWPMGHPPRAAAFPRRNRIISGLSLGVLVIEAGRRSGALITARLAAEEHGREVMVLPGRVDSPASAGCLMALREGWGRGRHQLRRRARAAPVRGAPAPGRPCRRRL